MDLMDLLRRRRSIRRFTADEIPSGVLKDVLSAGVLAPTSKGKRPWSFYVVRDKTTLAALSAAKTQGGAFLKGCDTAIVAAADCAVSDVWIEDLSIAMSYMQLAAQSHGLGSCWVQMRNRRDAAGRDAEENVRRILALEPPLRLVGVLALGMSAETKPPYPPEETERLLERHVQWR